MTAPIAPTAATKKTDTTGNATPRGGLPIPATASPAAREWPACSTAPLVSGAHAASPCVCATSPCNILRVPREWAHFSCIHNLVVAMPDTGGLRVRGLSKSYHEAGRERAARKLEVETAQHG